MVEGMGRTMEQISGDEETPAGRTIVINRPSPRRGPSRLLLPLLFLSVMLNLFLFAGRGDRVSDSLDERYVAGSTLPTAAKVAIVEVEGAIWEENVERVLAQVRRARDDVRVKGVILRVDSPGGTVSGSDRIWREVESLKARGKPVIASLGGTAASGGYYVAAAADKILAEPTTLTGSIGVKFELPQVGELLEKVGVDFEVLTTGPWKDSGSIYRPLTDAERARWMELLEDAHGRFVRVVARGRHLKLEEARAVADGRVLTASEAIDRQLVDRVGYLDDAIVQVQGMLGLEAARVVRYARPVSLSDLLPRVEAAAASGNTPALETLLRLRTPRLLYLAY